MRRVWAALVRRSSNMWNILRRRKDRPVDDAHGTDNFCVYAIGDIHGRADLLTDVCRRIDDDLRHRQPAQTIQVFLGDYIDRGPASSAVISALAARRQHGNVVCLRGNHEACLLDFLQTPDALVQWRQFGGLQTLMSYGFAPSANPDAAERIQLSQALRKTMPVAHIDFLLSLPAFFEIGKYFFVHAGIRPGVSLDRQREEDLLWIRDDFLLCEDDFGKIIVHGHTPVREPQLLPNRINIDTGAYATGRLTCIRLQGSRIDLL